MVITMQNKEQIPCLPLGRPGDRIGPLYPRHVLYEATKGPGIE